MTTLILTYADLHRLATMEAAVQAVERAFGAFSRGEAQMPAKVYLSLPNGEGDFRAMPALMDKAAGIKWVNSHPHNPARHGLPTVMAVYVLNDPDTALPLAIMDGTLLTALRTGAAAGVASKYLARRKPQTVGFIGCGVQAHFILEAHRAVFGAFEPIFADLNPEVAADFAQRYGGRAVDVADAAGADIVCTATPSFKPFVRRDWVQSGAHINAMGADAPGKQELYADVLKGAAVYIDDLHQAEGSGEINVPLATGEYTVDQIAGALGDVVAGKLARPDADTLTVFDSTGLAIQDVALAKTLYDAARSAGVGHAVDLCGLERDK